MSFSEANPHPVNPKLQVIPMSNQTAALASLPTWQTRECCSSRVENTSLQEAPCTAYQRAVPAPCHVTLEAIQQCILRAAGQAELQHLACPENCLVMRVFGDCQACCMYIPDGHVHQRLLWRTNLLCTCLAHHELTILMLLL